MKERGRKGWQRGEKGRVGRRVKTVQEAWKGGREGGRRRKGRVVRNGKVGRTEEE